MKKRMQRFWTDVNNTPPPTRLGEFIPVTQKYVVKMRDRANGSMPHDRARRKNSVTGVFFTSYFGKYVQSYAACFLAIVTKIGKKRKILIKSGFFVLK